MLGDLFRLDHFGHFASSPTHKVPVKTGENLSEIRREY